MPQKFDIKHDVRVLERNLKEGVLSKKEYEEFISKLEDISENAVPVETMLNSESEKSASDTNNGVESEEQ